MSWNSTCFGQFLCPSSGVYSLYTQQWYMSYGFVDSFRAGSGAVPSWSCSKAVWHMPLLSVQWINSWWRTEKLSETCGVSWQNKFVKLVHLVVFITKKYYVVKVLTAQCNPSFKLKNLPFHNTRLIRLFLCFDMNNSLWNFVQAF